MFLLLLLIFTASIHITVYANEFDDQAEVEAEAGMTWDEIMEMSQQSSRGLTPIQGLVLWMFAMLAFLKLAQKMDGMLQSLGLNVSQTGGRVMGDLLMAGFAISKIGGMASKITGRGGSSAGSSGGKQASSGGGRNASPPGGGRPIVPSNPSGGRPAPNEPPKKAPINSDTGGSHHRNPGSDSSLPEKASRRTSPSGRPDMQPDTNPHPYESSQEKMPHPEPNKESASEIAGEPPVPKQGGKLAYMKGLGKATLNRGVIGAGSYIGKSAYRGVAGAFARRKDGLGENNNESPKPIDGNSKDPVPPQIPNQPPSNVSEWNDAKPKDSSVQPNVPNESDWIDAGYSGSTDAVPPSPIGTDYNSGEPSDSKKEDDDAGTSQESDNPYFDYTAIPSNPSDSPNIINPENNENWNQTAPNETGDGVPSGSVHTDSNVGNIPAPAQPDDTINNDEKRVKDSDGSSRPKHQSTNESPNPKPNAATPIRNNDVVSAAQPKQPIRSHTSSTIPQSTPQAGDVTQPTAHKPHVTMPPESVRPSANPGKVRTESSGAVQYTEQTGQNHTPSHHTPVRSNNPRNATQSPHTQDRPNTVTRGRRRTSDKKPKK